jgi:adenylate kinase
VDVDPPAEPGTCRRCGGEVRQRADDQEETVRARLEVYANQTAPLVAHYRAKGILEEVRGDGSVDDIFRELLGRLTTGS